MNEAILRVVKWEEFSVGSDLSATPRRCIGAARVFWHTWGEALIFQNNVARVSSPALLQEAANIPRVSYAISDYHAKFPSAVLAALPADSYRQHVCPATTAQTSVTCDMWCVLRVTAVACKVVGRPVPQEKVALHGVDVTGSNFLSRPAVLEAAAFAEAAHQGQMRRTGDPYIMHCVETACIVEGLLALSEVTEDDARWLPARLGSTAFAGAAHAEQCMRCFLVTP